MNIWITSSLRKCIFNVCCELCVTRFQCVWFLSLMKEVVVYYKSFTIKRKEML